MLSWMSPKMWKNPWRLPIPLGSSNMMQVNEIMTSAFPILGDPLYWPNFISTLRPIVVVGQPKNMLRITLWTRKVPLPHKTFCWLLMIEYVRGEVHGIWKLRSWSGVAIRKFHKQPNPTAASTQQLGGWKMYSSMGDNGGTTHHGNAEHDGMAPHSTRTKFWEKSKFNFH